MFALGGQGGCEVQGIEVFVKIHKKIGGGGVGGGRVKFEVFVKILKKKYFFFWGGGLGGGGGLSRGVRVDVYEELKFLRKFTKTKISGRGGGEGGGGGVFGLGGSGGCEQGNEVFVKIHKKIWGGGGWVGQAGCERKIEVFVKILKKKIFLAGGGGGGGVRGGGGGGAEWWGQGGCVRRIEVFEKIQKKNSG